jgi:hypothetical protein
MEVAVGVVSEPESAEVGPPGAVVNGGGQRVRAAQQRLVAIGRGEVGSRDFAELLREYGRLTVVDVPGGGEKRDRRGAGQLP